MSCYVIGAGKTRFGPSTHAMPRLAQEAILGALDDAGMSIEDIEAFIVANFLGGPNESQLHLNSVIAGLFPGVRRPGWRVEAACASGGAAVHQAVHMLAAYDPILVIGVERLSGRPTGELTRNIGMAGDVILDQLQGLNFPASYALVAQRHMQRYGTRTDDFEILSLKNHANAQLNPLAHFYHKQVSQADIDCGATVATPLRLFDCCPVSDGASAVILSAEAKDARSVPLIGTGLSTDVISLAQRDEHDTFASAREAARMAYAQAGISPSDIDLAEVHDCFTIAEIVAMEDLGLAAPGEAVDLIRAGQTSTGGELPINPSGGLKAGGHAISATGVGQVYEACQQLRGEAGDRQVRDARVAVTHNVGGVGGTCAVQVLGRPS
ncbi:MAG: thiolase domain-containing protein [Actinobacteria bacterium]|nr:thiolase domain-containing protein [Actinomycetota bacterium]